jgi:hypothetical protein
MKPLPLKNESPYSHHEIGKWGIGGNIPAMGTNHEGSCKSVVWYRTEYSRKCRKRIV